MARETRTLSKAFQLLQVLAAHEKDASVKALHLRTGLPKSTIVRLLSTMCAYGLVIQDQETRRYRLGWTLIFWGQRAKHQCALPVILKPFIERLAKETGETASLAVLDGFHAVYIEQVMSQNLVKGVPPVGKPLPLHCTAVGKILLTSFSKDQIQKFLEEKGLPALTEKTITDADQLQRMLVEVKQHGYAIDDEETEKGGRCIAAPVFNTYGKIVAALSIIGPIHRIKDDKIKDYAALVRRVALEASAYLGFVP
ncbi:MAG: IclR family transcriptional regulator [Candidatus Methanomethyliaceae archaeon]